MRKKVRLETSQRRPVNFAGRVGDIFERKFDGFPARVPPKSGRLQAEEGDIFGIDLEQIIADLIEQEQGIQIPDSTIPPCPSSECYTVLDSNCGRTDNFIRSTSGTFGTPSDGGSDWTSLHNDPYGVSFGIATLWAHGPITGGIVTGAGYDAVLASGCLDCVQHDLYFRFQAQDLVSNPQVGIEESPGQWLIPNSGETLDALHEHWLKIIYGSRLGHTIVFSVEPGSNLLKAALGNTNTPYFSDPVSIADFGGPLDKIFKVHARFTPSKTEVSVWEVGIAEPTPQLQKTVLGDFQRSAGSLTELGSSVQFQAGGYSLPAQTLPATSINLRQTNNDPLRIECHKLECPPSGSQTLETLTRVETPELHYTAPSEVSYYTDVYYDNLPSVQGLDYLVIDGDVYPTDDIDSSVVVTARYVAA